MSELLNCPYCGSSDVGCDGHECECDDCHAIGPYLTIPNRDEAVRRWNRRAPDPLITAIKDRLAMPISDMEKVARIDELIRKEGYEAVI